MLFRYQRPYITALHLPCHSVPQRWWTDFFVLWSLVMFITIWFLLPAKMGSKEQRWPQNTSFLCSPCGVLELTACLCASSWLLPVLLYSSTLPISPTSASVLSPSSFCVLARLLLCPCSLTPPHCNPESFLILHCSGYSYHCWGFKRRFSFILCVWMFCLNVCKYTEYMPGPHRCRSGSGSLGTQLNGWVWATMCVLGTQPRFLAREASACNHRTISPASCFGVPCFCVQPFIKLFRWLKFTVFFLESHFPGQLLNKKGTPGRPGCSLRVSS